MKAVAERHVAKKRLLDLHEAAVKVGAPTVSRPEFSLEHRRPMPATAQLEASASSSDTEIKVGPGCTYGVGDLIMVPSTGEMMRIVGRSPNSLRVVRALGTTSAPLAEGEFLLKVAGGSQVEVIAKQSWRARLRSAIDTQMARAVAGAERQVSAWRTSEGVNIVTNRLAWMGVGMAWGATLWSLL